MNTNNIPSNRCMLLYSHSILMISAPFVNKERAAYICICLSKVLFLSLQILEPKTRKNTYSIQFKTILFLSPFLFQQTEAWNSTTRCWMSNQMSYSGYITKYKITAFNFQVIYNKLVEQFVRLVYFLADEPFCFPSLYTTRHCSLTFTYVNIAGSLSWWFQFKVSS